MDLRFEYMRSCRSVVGIRDKWDMINDYCAALQENMPVTNICPDHFRQQYNAAFGWSRIWVVNHTPVESVRINYDHYQHK